MNEFYKGLDWQQADRLIAVQAGCEHGISALTDAEHCKNLPTLVILYTFTDPITGEIIFDVPRIACAGSHHQEILNKIVLDPDISEIRVISVGQYLNEIPKLVLRN